MHKTLELIFCRIPCDSEADLGTPVTQSLSLQLQSRMSEIPPALDEVERFLEGQHVGEDVLFRFRLALDELLTNSVMHGSQDGGTHAIELAVTVDDRHAICVLRDDGAPFDPLSAPEPDITADLEDRNIGGLGIHLVREFFSDFEYQRDAGWNILRFATPIAVQN